MNSLSLINNKNNTNNTNNKNNKKMIEKNKKPIIYVSYSNYILSLSEIEYNNQYGSEE